MAKDIQDTLIAANNYAKGPSRYSPNATQKTGILRKIMPVARRVLAKRSDGDKLYAEGGTSSQKPRHTRRSPRGRDDARGDGTDRAARAWRRAPGHAFSIEDEICENSPSRLRARRELARIEATTTKKNARQQPRPQRATVPANASSRAA